MQDVKLEELSGIKRRKIWRIKFNELETDVETNMPEVYTA